MPTISLAKDIANVWCSVDAVSDMTWWFSNQPAGAIRVTFPLCQVWTPRLELVRNEGVPIPSSQQNTPDIVECGGRGVVKPHANPVVPKNDTLDSPAEDPEKTSHVHPGLTIPVTAVILYSSCRFDMNLCGNSFIRKLASMALPNRHSEPEMRLFAMHISKARMISIRKITNFTSQETPPTPEQS
ncbi:hypothetical protein MKZ38_007943 [Zalerion maritima]|uniref:Uncharacterized protein n=1 Tax=Zalerion maritima TaxID=339359 RepID=A0AAD5WU27_9PEZI|nr:hypothetical protein MKZ38_007943 [Zalerion maritima]